MTFLEAALRYRNKYNFSVIPVSKTKKPIIKWEEFQKRIATEEEITKWWTDTPDANIGIVTGLISGIAVIDIDTDEGKETIQEYIPESTITPTVETPRGGQHLYFKCTDTKLTNNARGITGCDLRANGGYVLAPPSVNGKGNAYSWIVSLKNSISSLPDKYINKINSFSLYEGVRTETLQSLTTSNIILQDGRRGEDLFHVAWCLIKNRTSTEETTQVLEILARNCNPPFSKSEIADRIKSALKRVERRDRNLAHEVLSFINLTKGYINLTEVYNTLQILTKEEKSNVYVIMNRLVKEGVVERFGNKNGQFRKIESEIETIDWYDADEMSHLPIEYPLDLHKYVLTLPKNIVVIAGSKDAGKTAFLLNVAAINRDKFKVYYFSSEMGEVEMKKRLVKLSKRLNISLKELKEKVTWINRAGDFPDLIFPEALNIIDFLEITKDFYEVSDIIKNIYHKLTTGVVVLAIQKPSSRDMPIGGEKGLEKARLAIAIDNGRAKILVGKNWAQDFNPRGYICRFHILDGCKIQIAEDWNKPE